MSSRKRLIDSAIAGSSFALLTWILIGDRWHATVIRAVAEYSGTLIVSLLPGFVLVFAVSRNIHAANTWLVAIGNFLFYSVLVYLLIVLWTKRRRRALQPPASLG
jgi:hypothetical protein